MLVKPNHLTAFRASPRMPLLFISCIALTHCSVNHGDFDKVRTERDSLRQLLTRTDNAVFLENSFIMEMTSKHTQQTYDIYIRHPNDYKDSRKTYPLLLVLDAEVNFGGVSYISQRLAKGDLAPEQFIVGIAYHGETDTDTFYSLRAKDFTPTVDKAHEQRHKNMYQAGTGGAENFVKFLSLELLPYLETNYPIAKKGRTIYGHSFGGLFGAHVLINHPALFDNYVLLSPSLWWDNKVTLKGIHQHRGISLKGKKVYIGTGELEDTMVDDHLTFVDTITKLNQGNSNLKSEILDSETHRTIFGRGFTNGLRFVYAK
jgi:predicted alpha/beta superfamily hydrolase